MNLKNVFRVSSPSVLLLLHTFGKLCGAVILTSSSLSLSTVSQGSGSGGELQLDVLKTSVVDLACFSNTAALTLAKTANDEALLGSSINGGLL